MNDAYKKQHGVVVSIVGKTRSAKRLIKDYGSIVRKMNESGDEIRMQHPILEDPMKDGFFSYWVKKNEIEWKELE